MQKTWLVSTFAVVLGLPFGRPGADANAADHDRPDTVSCHA
jgi:hypothetical protein